jgi:hypothetical protein
MKLIDLRNKSMKLSKLKKELELKFQITDRVRFKVESLRYPFSTQFILQVWFYFNLRVWSHVMFQIHHKIQDQVNETK